MLLDVRSVLPYPRAVNEFRSIIIIAVIWQLPLSVKEPSKGVACLSHLILTTRRREVV